MLTYFQVSDIFSTFIKQLNEENDGNVWAKAYNKRGHAKYMAVNFDDALEDYEAALTRGIVISYLIQNRNYNIMIVKNLSM